MSPASPARYPGEGDREKRRRRWGRAFAVIAGMAALGGVVALALLLGEVLVKGVPYLSGHFFSDYASRFPERAGIRAPLLGTLWVLGLTAVISLPASIGAAIYLEEYAPPNWATAAIRANVASLAGVPPMVYGLLGLALFVRGLGLGRSVLAGALTLSLLVMPLVIRASQEAISAVPRSVREGAYALGATRWEVVRYQVLPAALPGIVSGAILALARAAGETAPLILIGVVSFIAFTPETVGDPFTVIPLQIFDWVSRPQAEFRGLAAAAILVLLALIFTMSVVGVWIGNRFRRPV